MRRFKLAVAVIMASAVILAGCGAQIKVNESTPAQTNAETAEPQTEAEETTQAIKIDNEKPVKLYYMDYGDNTADLIRSFATPWTDSQDIGVFGAFNSDEEEISFDSEIAAHQELWDGVATKEEYRIGYEVSFDAAGTHYVYTLLEPQDIEDAQELFSGDVDSEEVTGYLGVWMYDDINQIEGMWYSHVTPMAYSDETILTSIKLRLTPACDEVSNLKLKAFSYSSELEFDADNHYNNEYGYEISIVPEK